MHWYGVLLLLLVSLRGESQESRNLVPNASFEKFKNCPVSFNANGSLELVDGWRQATTGTVDYYNVCSYNAGVPENLFGKQMPAEGEGYIGLITYSPSKRNYREYLQVKLAEKLKKDQKYCIEVYVSQADFSNYLSDGLGILLSEQKVVGQRDKILPFVPQIENPPGHVIHHADSWVLVSDTIRAKGGEQYLTIGNYRPDHMLKVMRRNMEQQGYSRVWNHAYYYLDQLSVKMVRRENDCACTLSEIRKMLNDPGYPFTYVEMKSMAIGAVLFDFDKDVPIDLYTAELDNVTRMMRKYTSYYLVVHGHTDIVGTLGYNNGLSRRRAEYVYNYLKQKGINENRLRIEYHGENQPADRAQGSDANAKNRRVEFELLQL